MDSRIQTNSILDLPKIFDPTAQETEDTGGARILYTFDAAEQPVRQRVGDDFILEVFGPTVTFFVSAPVEASITDGYIVPAVPMDGIQDRYRLTESDISQLVIDISLATGFGSEDDILALLEQ